MAQRGSALPRGRGKEGWRDARAVRRVAPLAQHGKALHGTARVAPASRGASQRPPPCPRLSPLCCRRFHMRRRHFRMRRSDVPKHAPPRAPANRGRARGRRPDYGNGSASIRIDPSELLRGRRPWARARPSESKVPMLARMRRRRDRSSRVPKKNAPAATRPPLRPRDIRKGSKRSVALRTLRFRATAPAAAGSESRSATVCSSLQFKSKASVSFIQRAAAEKH